VKPDFISDDKPLLKPSGRWAILGAIIATLAVCGIALQYVLQFRQGSSSSTQLETSSSAVNAVSALGQIKPEGEIISLSAPTSMMGIGTSRVDRLLVDEGDYVKAGQVIAVLSNYQMLQAALAVALEEVKVSQSNLAQVKVGAQEGELEAQQATIAQLQADLQGQLAAQEQTITRLAAEQQNAQVEYQRYLSLFKEGAVTASQLDSKRLTMITAQEQLTEAQVNRSRIETTLQAQIKSAQATLDQLAEVRPTDLQAAQAEVDRAFANVTKAQADLEQAYVRSPIDGQVLKIHTRPGETVNDQGIVALARTDQMNVIAEVYELDVGKLRKGQTATITSNAFSEPLHGTVIQIGQQVNPQDVLSTDPTADVNRRIVEVKIRLHQADSRKVADLTNLQVNVVIGL
jgi:HlyD family secretion protein